VVLFTAFKKLESDTFRIKTSEDVRDRFTLAAVSLPVTATVSNTPKRTDLGCGGVRDVGCEEVMVERKGWLGGLVGVEGFGVVVGMEGRFVETREATVEEVGVKVVDVFKVEAVVDVRGVEMTGVGVGGVVVERGVGVTREVE
jgi:hypothetical protein